MLAGRPGDLHLAGHVRVDQVHVGQLVDGQVHLAQGQPKKIFFLNGKTILQKWKNVLLKMEKNLNFFKKIQKLKKVFAFYKIFQKIKKLKNFLPVQLELHLDPEIVPIFEAEILDNA